MKVTHRLRKKRIALTLNGDVLHREMVFPVVDQALLERTVLLGSDVLRVRRLYGCRHVKLFVRYLLLLDLLGHFLLRLIVLILVFLNLRLLTLLDFLCILILDFL
jgi:hypothetical protein